MEIYKVLIGGRDCLSGNRVLQAGDYIHAYGIFMVKIATATEPYETTSMFDTEPCWDRFKGFYREATQREIAIIAPHLSKGKKFNNIRNWSNKLYTK